MTPATPQVSLESSPAEWGKRVIHRKYYPHVDGVRCLAILPVVLYHLASKVCPGGFVGVDVFFVISGYLIYGGILEDLRKGDFTLASFYYRRIRRIFPAYLAVVCCTLLLGIILYHWARLVPLAQTGLFSAFFSTNLFFWLTIGYFQPTANENPLLHLWTLGVEEQFYLVIPLLSLGLWKLSRASLKPALVVLCAGSLLLCIAMARTGESTTAFYLLPTRAWELLAGALLVQMPRPRDLRSAAVLAVLGLLLVLLPCWCFDTAKTFMNRGTSVEFSLPLLGPVGIFPFPGIAAIPVDVGSLLLLRYGDFGPVSRLLGSALFTGVGKISYSLYLWHWPIFVFARYIEYDRQTPLGLASVFVLSLLAAYLSWRWVEMPVRVNKGFTPRLAFTSVGLGCGLLVAGCSLLIYTQGLRDVIHIKANHYASAQYPLSLYLQKFRITPRFHPTVYPDVDKNYFTRLGVPGQNPTFCLMGDSLAGAIVPGLDRAAADHRQAGLYISRRKSPFITGSIHDPQDPVLEWMGSISEIHDIYLVGNWLKAYGLVGGIAELGDKGHVPPVVVEPATLQTIESNFRHTAEWFRARGKRVFVFTSNPEYRYAPADMMARSQLVPLDVPLDVTREDYLRREEPILRILSALEKEGLISVVPAGLALVEGDHTVIMSPDGDPYYRDGDHLTPDAAYRECHAVAPILWP